MSPKQKQLLGWYGAFAILLAYALLSLKVIKSDSYIYQVLNLTGAIGIIIEALSKGDKQPAFLNIAWALIALIGIISLIVS
ncbi:MAG TPA: hypothetical protein VL989_00835 [Candidatus Sulfotelmatobacter sp.]|nr:hypothetical protein [Candidatus Sulfotelmatobacter sp.]